MRSYRRRLGRGQLITMHWACRPHATPWSTSLQCRIVPSTRAVLIFEMPRLDNDNGGGPEMLTRLDLFSMHTIPLTRTNQASEGVQNRVLCIAKGHEDFDLVGRQTIYTLTPEASRQIPSPSHLRPPKSSSRISVKAFK